MVNAGTPAVCLVGKTHVFHVETALGIPLEENLANIAHSVAHPGGAWGARRSSTPSISSTARGPIPDYALACLKAALDAGARWVVLCDTNGGTLPAEVGAVDRGGGRGRRPRRGLGIHTHDDTGNAVANTLAAVDAGARQVQGTLNGLGERCGNANLVSLIPTLLLKEPYASRFETGVSARGRSPELTRVSRLLDDILNRVPDRAAPYVGASAFTHKAGLHASAILKDPADLRARAARGGGQRPGDPDVEPGRAVEPARAAGARPGSRWRPGDPRLAAILAEVKEREDRGFAYDGASASFEILARADARADAALLRGRALPGDGRAADERRGARW